MLYAPLALGAAVGSSIGSALMVVKFCRDWDVRVSSVRWLFTLFFGYLWVYITARVIYNCWLVHEVAHPSPELIISASKLDRLGIFSVVRYTSKTDPWIRPVLSFGNMAHFGATLWVFPLAYELFRLVATAMDRGIKTEQHRIRAYCLVGHVAIACFAVAETLINVVYRDKSYANYALLIVRHVMQISALIFMTGLLIALKRSGRDREAVHGQFIASPLYHRLKWMMFVYAIFALQFSLTLLIQLTSPDNESTERILCVSGILYNATVLALSIVTGCSLTCVVKCCRWCLPVDAATMRRKPDDLATYFEFETPISLVIAPVHSPVFVFTDIESSSALWAIGDGRVMQKAVQIHDDILRSRLAPHRGYEITTAGDAFQLAFHTMREAAEYCIDVQNRLLAADWPDELHNMVPATAKERWGHRYVFRGLRVRMGIHDAAECEGPLVVDVHAVTGKTTYTGASEVVASSVGDLGAGGQIVATRRVAEWLEQHSELVDERFEVDFLCELVVPQVNVRVELFQIIPTQLRARRHWFDGETPPDVVAKSRSRRLKLPIGGGFSGNPEFETVELSVSSSGSWHWSPRPSDHHARSSL